MWDSDVSLEAQGIIAAVMKLNGIFEWIAWGYGVFEWIASGYRYEYSVDMDLDTVMRCSKKL